MKTKCHYLIFLLLCLSQALYAQYVPIGPIDPIDPEKPIKPIEPSEWLEAGDSIIKTLVYHDAGENKANHYLFALGRPMMVSFNFTDFTYSPGYGSPLPQTTIYLNCNLMETSLDRSELLFAAEVDGKTGKLLQGTRNKPVKLAAGFYQFTFTGHFTDLFPRTSNSGIVPFTSVIPPPTYFLDLQIMAEAVPSKPVYTDPDDEVLPSIPVPDSDMLTPLQASAGMNSVCSFASNDGSRDKGNLSVSYVDGLGRIMETARKGNEPQGGNLVSMQEYDSWGRKGNDWLEAAKDGEAGAYVSPVECRTLASQTNNGDSRPYAETVYEASPLNRPVRQYKPGQEWHDKGKSVNVLYTTNTADAGELGCLMFTAVEGFNSDMTVTASGYYSAGSLQVVKAIDEDGKVRLEFTDRTGNIILHRQIEFKGSVPAFCDTYYIYNDIGNLQAVLPPELSAKATESGSLVKAELDKYAYLYFYDNFHRVSERKLPGADLEHFVYDDNDHLVFSQDGNLNKEGKWKFTIADKQGRVCLEGVCASYRFIIDRLDPVRYACCEYIGAPGEYHGYTVDGMTMVEPVFHKVAYYDNYRFLDDGLMPEVGGNNAFEYVSTSGYGEKYVSAKVKLTGVLTGEFSAAVDGRSAGDFMGSVFYYDARGRLIQSRSSNHLGGIDAGYTAYNFNGQPLKQLHVHSVPGKSAVSELYTHTYNDMGLPLVTKHQLGNGSEIILSDKVYDVLGRVAQEKRNGNRGLLSVYSYNVRSWLASITGTSFSQSLHYNTGSGTPCFNGNISSMTWKAGDEGTVRGYKFTYDGLNRMVNAAYGETDAINVNAGRFSEAVAGYDRNGNITALQRYGQTSASTYGLIDNLSYTLDGNQLNRVDDAAGAAAYDSGFEFVNAASRSDEYVYDANGNLTKDLDKNITDIQYNFLNLPSRVVFSDGSTISYLYAADGTKLRTVHVIGGTTTTTDYCGNVIYENGVAKLLLTEEGYVTLTDNRYHYYLQDYQGNNRVIVSESGSVEEVNHYYPFGGLYANSSSSVQPYKYNGKELDTKKGLNWYDYGARWYDAAVGRFTTVDPMAEKYHSESPYSYCGNNPIMFIDPTGMLISPIYDRNGKLLGTDDEGLKGKAIIMDKSNFKQGMSHEEALSHSLGYKGLINDEARSNYVTNYTGLKDRPDYDGYLTINEANKWYREGEGQPLFTSLKKIDLSGIYSLGEKYVGQIKSFNLLLHSGSLNDGLVYGNITLKRYPNHSVRAFSDKYDFEMHNIWNPLNWGRNAETIIGNKVAGEGQPYEINIYGSGKLTPLLPWIK
mgnify:CR=1 FL=1